MTSNRLNSPDYSGLQTDNIRHGEHGRTQSLFPIGWDPSLGPALSQRRVELVTLVNKLGLRGAYLSLRLARGPTYSYQLRRRRRIQRRTFYIILLA